MKPQPIETAPKNGTVILTNCGLAKFKILETWTDPIEGWSNCDSAGNVFQDEGLDYRCHPTLWTPLPEWIN